MERKIIIKWLKMFSIGYIAIFIIELVILISLSNFIIISIDSEQFTILSLLLNSGYVDLELPILWIFYGITSSAFLILGIGLFRIGKQDQRTDQLLAKTLLITGMFMIIANFFKFELIYLINGNLIDNGVFSERFINVITNNSSPAFLGAWMWNLFTFITLTVLISSLIISAVGLQWGILQFRQNNTD